MLADLCNTGERREHDSAWLERLGGVGDCGSEVVNERKYLCKDHAVESVLWNILTGTQIADNRRLGIAGLIVQHIRTRDLLASKRCGVRAIADFENMP